MHRPWKAGKALRAPTANGSGSCATPAREFVQSTAYFGPVSQDWILASAKRRTMPDGTFGGAIVIGVPVSSLVYSLDRTDLPEAAKSR